MSVNYTSIIYPHATFTKHCAIFHIFSPARLAMVCVSPSLRSAIDCGDGCRARGEGGRRTEGEGGAPPRVSGGLWGL